MELNAIREKIDVIDTQLIGLLNARAELVHQVGELKKAHGLEIYAPEREEAVLQALVKKSQGGLMPASAIRAIYREIMSAAMALEKGVTIAYFGHPASWTHQAACFKFGASVNYVSQPAISDVFDAVAKKKADYGVVPIENSIEGAVNHTLDVFMDSELKIYGQVLLPIENHLLSNVPIDKIERVYSHPQVFAQCRNWLLKNFSHVDLIEEGSTALAAKRASSEKNAAALAGKMASEVYNLPILAESVQDASDNTTRFLVIANQTCPPTGDDRTSVMFSVHNHSGALYNALRPFKDFRISMSRIQSRPSKRKVWEYCFFVDLEGHCEDAAIKKALEALSEYCTFIKILGSYPAQKDT